VDLPRLDPQTLPGPASVERHKLENGITVLIRENFLSPSVVIQGSLEAGGLDESEAKAGLAGMTSSSLMRGTEQRSFHEIYEALESVGASLGFGSGMHTTTFYAHGLAEDFGSLTSLAAEALRRPSFPAEQVERLRGEYLTQLAIRQEDTGDRAQLAFAELAYEGHPYAHDEDGTPETIQSITREEIVQFHSGVYGPRGMILTVAGAVHSGRALAMIEKYFADWHNPNQPVRATLPPAPRLQELRERRVSLPGKSQADLVLGVPGPARASADFFPALIGNNILGRFGTFGRIGEAVREDEGLAYYAFSSLAGGLGPGPWMAIAGVNPRNIERALELIRREIGRFVQTKVTAVELTDNQASLIGRLPLQLESNEGLAAALMNIELFNLGLEYYQRFPGLVAAVTREEILETARRYLHPDRLAIGIAGPLSEPPP
jgi:zinc protease